jgi:hypothetical protein
MAHHHHHHHHAHGHHHHGHHGHDHTGGDGTSGGTAGGGTGGTGGSDTGGTGGGDTGGGGTADSGTLGFVTGLLGGADDSFGPLAVSLAGNTDGASAGASSPLGFGTDGSLVHVTTDPTADAGAQCLQSRRCRPRWRLAGYISRLGTCAASTRRGQSKDRSSPSTSGPSTCAGRRSSKRKLPSNRALLA